MTANTRHQRDGSGNMGGEDNSSLSFPLKLHAMLEDADNDGFSNIVSWQAGDKSFKVHSADRFANEIMPRYFNQTKFKSFQRQ